MDCAAMEQPRGVFAGLLKQEIFAAGVLIHKLCGIMNNTINEKQTTTVTNCLGIFFETPDWKFVYWCPPGKFLAPEFKLTLKLLVFTLLNLIFGEPLQVRGQVDFLAEPDEPFRRIPVKPSDPITVVHGKLVMEIVVPFTPSNESDKP